MAREHVNVLGGEWGGVGIEKSSGASNNLFTKNYIYNTPETHTRTRYLKTLI